MAVDVGADHHGVVLAAVPCAWAGIPMPYWAGWVSHEQLIGFLRGQNTALGGARHVGVFALDHLVLEEYKIYGGARVAPSGSITIRQGGELYGAWVTKTGRPCWRSTASLVRSILIEHEDQEHVHPSETYKAPALKRMVMARYPQTGGGKTPAIGVVKAPGPLWCMKLSPVKGQSKNDHHWDGLRALVAAWLDGAFR
jgi:hypothetical protein